MSAHTQKTCTWCGRAFLITNSAARLGRGKYCSRPCRAAHKLAAMQARTEKRCGGPCKATKPVDAFNKRRGQRDGRDNFCRDCRNAEKKADYSNDRAAIRERRNAWRAENKTTVADWNRRTYERHGPEMRAKNRARRASDPEAYRKRARAYYAANTERFRASIEKRRARDPEGYRAVRRVGGRRYQLRKRGALTAHFTAEQVAQRVSVFGGRCAYCGGPFEHIDHLKPIALGGPHILANLRPSCRRCNQRKHKTPARAWLAACKAGSSRGGEAENWGSG